MKANELLRNDETLKVTIATNLRVKAIEAEKLRLAVGTMLSTVMNNPRWENEEVTKLVFQLSQKLPKASEFEARATNDAYLGNCAAFERIV